MEIINLENDLKLSFEKLPHTIRLIVSKDNEELVCRKEKLRNLFAFTKLIKAQFLKDDFSYVNLMITLLFCSKMKISVPFQQKALNKY